MKHRLKKAGNLIVQIATLLVFFAIAFILLVRAELISLPNFLQGIFGNDEEIASETKHDDQEIFNFIGSAPDTETEFSDYPQISAENMNTLLNSLSAHKNFYWESVSKTFSSKAVVTKDCRSRISGDKYNVEILNEDGNVTKKFISNGKKTLITKYYQGSSESSLYEAGIFDFYSDAGLISVDYFKDADFSDGNCEIRLVENDQYNLVSVVHTYERNGVTVKNSYGISLDFGVVLFAECFENDVPVFEQTTLSIYPVSSLDDKLFAVN